MCAGVQGNPLRRAAVTTAKGVTSPRAHTESAFQVFKKEATLYPFLKPEIAGN